MTVILSKFCQPQRSPGELRILQLHGLAGEYF